MDASQIYILISIIILLVIAVVLFLVKKNKKPKKFTPLAGLSFAFLLLGILSTDSKIISYIFMGIGIILAVIDIIKNKN
jgi:asparagine N-glycosylation enzyme membrane subunit Stt3